jgi:hypothetical protein
MTDVQHLEVLQGGQGPEERAARLDEGAAELADGSSRSVLGRDRFLLTVSAALMTLGLAAILLGWAGASRTTIAEEQTPYLISGGLFGVAVAIIGAVTFFAHWITVLIREDREREAARQRDHRELVAELRRLAPPALAEEVTTNGRARSGGRERPVRRSPRG